MMHCTNMHCNALYYNAMHCTKMQYNALYYKAIQCTTQCNAIHLTKRHTTVLFCIVLLRTDLYITVLYCKVLHYVALCYITLCYVALCYITLCHIALWRLVSLLLLLVPGLPEISVTRSCGLRGLWTQAGGPLESGTYNPWKIYRNLGHTLLCTMRTLVLGKRTTEV